MTAITLPEAGALALVAPPDATAVLTHLRAIRVDADMGWAAPDVLRLLAHGRDMVSGIYESRGGTIHCIAHPRGARDAPSLLEVDGCGFGFVLLSRACIDAMLAAHGPYGAFAYLVDKRGMIPGSRSTDRWRQPREAGERA